MERGNTCLSGFSLKLIAIIAMVIDHIGFLFFPSLIFLRVIGRITFPIMAFFIAEGVSKTADIERYLKRLGIFALISAAPFYLLWKTPFNVIFTLLIGAAALNMTKGLSKKKALATVAFMSLLAAPCDWSAPGVIMIYIFHTSRGSLKSAFLKMLLLTAAAFAVFFAIGSAREELFQLGIFLAFPLLHLYNGRRGPKAKYLFYIFYPAHLFILWAVQALSR